MALALGCFAPSRALASCGDYVTMHSGGVAMDHAILDPIAPLRYGLAVSPSDGDARTLERSDPAPIAPCGRCVPNREAPGPLPCQGPWCSRGQSQPTDLPTTASPKPREQQAAHLPVPRLGVSGPVLEAALCARVTRIHRIEPIYHPPRSV
jgi:hypothetical protein